MRSIPFKDSCLRLLRLSLSLSLSVWSVLQKALQQLEEGHGLSRKIFETADILPDVDLKKYT